MLCVCGFGVGLWIDYVLRFGLLRWFLVAVLVVSLVGCLFW